MATYSNKSADALIRTGEGTLYGYIVNSHSSGTVKIIDGTSAGAGKIICNTQTLSTDTVPMLITMPAPVDFHTGLYIDIGGTCDYTVIWSER